MKSFQEYFATIFAFLVWMWDETQKRISSALADAKTFASGVAATAQSDAQVFATGAANNALNIAKAFANGVAATAQSNAKAFATSVADGALNTAKTFTTDVVSSKSASDRQYALELVSSEMSRIEALARVTAFLTVRAGDYKDGENLLSKLFVETLLGRALVGKDVIRIIFEYPLGMTQSFKLDEADILVDNGDELILVVENGLPKMQSRFDNTTSATIYNNTKDIAGNTKLIGETVAEVSATKTSITNHENRILDLEGFKSALGTFSVNLEAFKTAQLAKLLTYTAFAKSTKMITDFVETILWVKIEVDGFVEIRTVALGDANQGNQYYGYGFGSPGVLEIYNKSGSDMKITVSNAEIK